MAIIKKLIQISTLLCLTVGLAQNIMAQDDIMDDSGDYEQPATTLEPEYESPMESGYDSEAPPIQDDYIPPEADAAQEYEAPPSTPSEALKDFNHSQDERLEQLDSYEEDY